MLQFEKFNARDLKIIEDIPRGFKLSLFIFLVIAIPLSLLLGFVGLLGTRFSYWQIASGCFLFNVAVLIFKIRIDYFNYRRDLRIQQKIKLDFVVTGKSKKRGNWTITTNSSDLKKFAFDSKDTFDQICVGDKAVMEISRYSRRLLGFRKVNENVPDGL